MKEWNIEMNECLFYDLSLILIGSIRNIAALQKVNFKTKNKLLYYVIFASLSDKT